MSELLLGTGVAILVCLFSLAFGYYSGVKSVQKDLEVEPADEPPEYLRARPSNPTEGALTPEQIDAIDDWEDGEPEEPDDGDGSKREESDGEGSEREESDGEGSEREESDGEGSKRGEGG